MKNPFLLTLLILAVSVPALAEDRHQSYISYDDGGTVVRSAEDGREIEGRRNLPVYPGDEVITARRGRTELRLSDGNIIGIDRTTALRLRSVLDSYEGDDKETVAELRHGKVAVYRTDLGRDHVRLDTQNASYVAEHESIYSVETDSRGSDRIVVFEGTVEVRTPSNTARLRQGEAATVDGRGLYDMVTDQRNAADDFERWFLRRAERFESYDNQYVDRRLGYWTDDLDDHGRWVFVTGVGWSWRPFVAVGWRPYHHGYWHRSRGGFLTWVSYDPWGWGPYHYGRWAFDPGYGWVWVPGYGYSPAWVYWMYGPGYVGWAPAGWWDCYRPYYNWAYRGRDYTHHGFGFWGNVRVRELDLRPWTFVDSGAIVSNRIDRAALTTDAVRQRLSRSRDGVATISGGAARFTREELRDPADAIRRRGLDGRMTGRETGAPPTDLTPFVRREAEVPSAIRDRIVRTRDTGNALAPQNPSNTVRGGGVAPIGRGSIAPIDGGNVAPIGRGSVAPIGRGGVAPIGGGETQAPASGIDDRRSGDAGRIDRDNRPTVRTIGGERGSGPRDTERPSGSAWRDRIDRRERNATAPSAPAQGQTPSSVERSDRADSWRNRTVSRDRSDEAGSRSSTGGNPRSDVPRRVIDRIGGARVVPRDSSRSSSPRSTVREPSSRSSEPRRSTVRERSSRSSGSSRSVSPRSSGGSGSSARAPERSSGSSSRGSSSTGSSSGSSRGSSSGGRIKRDQ